MKPHINHHFMFDFKKSSLILSFLCVLLLSNAAIAQSTTLGDDILVEKNVMVAMRDGVKLATDIYRTKDAQPSPILVARTPYNKNNSRFDFERFVKAGYVIIIQDVRGRYTSEGDFESYVFETNDALDLYDWINKQTWSNGKIGTFGGSYLGGTQTLPARENPSALKVMVPEITFSNTHEGTAYQGGAKVLHDLRWIVSILPDLMERRRAHGEDVESPKSIPDELSVLNGLPLASHPYIEKYAPFYKEWLKHPSAGPYWETRSPNSGYENMTVPAMHISGWYDIFVHGTLENYTSMRDKAGSELSRKNQKLIMGPWTHMNFSGNFPELTFGPKSSSQAIDLDGIKLRWYNRWLKGIENGIDKEDPVMIFKMGINEWRTEKDWPLPDTKYQHFYLHSKGKANTLNGDGMLSREAPKKELSDTFTYDPMNPVPTLGGQVILPGPNATGPRDQIEVEKRDDVLIYSTPVLEKAVEVTGNLKLKLFISSSAPDTDFTAKLVDVYPNGKAMLLSTGIRRVRYRNSLEKAELMEPGKVYEIEIDLLATSNVFLPGHRIRLEVTSSNFPQFNRNSNTGGDIATETADKYRSAKNIVLHDQQYPSSLILPIIER